ncbi:MAG: class I SAM-dependent methyltransferase [Gammaproteobacteria bacterium]|nr:MAG: class I SAM-dependent methyltransferase [Gammaproteobacteria bacterium]
MQLERVHFARRADRSRYIADRFGHALQPSLLDVGCDRAVLRELLPLERYTGIDMGGTPDLRLDLEATERLPFEDESFDAVVCSDVLEHLDNLHPMFDELVRVASRHILISLPNNWCNARRPIARGKGHMAHYGLPLERPVDRHKWFFGFSEAREFLQGQLGRHPLQIVEMVANEKPRSAPIRALRRMRWPGERYLNRYAHTLWVLFRKQS